jgi:hypothetical protein
MQLRLHSRRSSPLNHAPKDREHLVIEWFWTALLFVAVYKSPHAPERNLRVFVKQGLEQDATANARLKLCHPRECAQRGVRVKTGGKVCQFLVKLGIV